MLPSEVDSPKKGVDPSFTPKIYSFEIQSFPLIMHYGIKFTSWRVYFQYFLFLHVPKYTI